jgi:molybdate transport system regulatory protein
MDSFPRVTFRIEMGAGRRLGPGKARLLELIAETGSISRAARAMGMSYRRAWLLVEDANRLFAEPLVESSAGGAGGGGAALTRLGEKAIAAYRDAEDAALTSTKKCFSGFPGFTVTPPEAGRRQSKRT